MPLIAGLESFLAGYHEAALSAALVSGLICIACLGLFLFVSTIDADVRRG